MAAARFLRRFSAIALAAVGLLGATAAVNVYSEIGSVEALWETHYGRLMILKTGLVVPLLALGYVARRHLARSRTPDSPGARHGFLRIAVLELVLMAAIVTVTATLVDEPPPRAAGVASS